MPEPPNSKAGWMRVAFGDVVRLAKARVADPEAAGIERFVGLEHIEPGDLRIRRWGDVADGTTFTTVFKAGQVLFGKRRAYQRKVAVADFEGVCSGDIYVLEPANDRLMPELLPFLCQTDAFFDHAVGTSAGSLSPRTNWTSLASFEFLLPTIQEQARLVEAGLAAEETINAYRQNIEALKGLRASFLNDHFLSRLKSGVPLKSVASLKSGGTPSRSNERYWRGSLPWASGKDLKVRLLSETEERLTSEGWAAAKIAPEGATLIVVRGMILAHTFPVSVAERPMAFNQDLRALVAGKTIRPAYLTAWAEWMGPWFLSRTAESSHGTKRLESQTVELALIPVENHAAQDEFIRADENILQEIRVASARLGSIAELKMRFLNRVTSVE
jgi:type I restriction enzyme S subunit